MGSCGQTTGQDRDLGDGLVVCDSQHTHHGAHGTESARQAQLYPLPVHRLLPVAQPTPVKKTPTLQYLQLVCGKETYDFCILWFSDNDIYFDQLTMYCLTQ